MVFIFSLSSIHPRNFRVSLTKFGSPGFVCKETVRPSGHCLCVGVFGKRSRKIKWNSTNITLERCSTSWSSSFPVWFGSWNHGNLCPKILDDARLLLPWREPVIKFDLGPQEECRPQGPLTEWNINFSGCLNDHFCPCVRERLSLAKQYIRALPLNMRKYIPGIHKVKNPAERISCRVLLWYVSRGYDGTGLTCGDRPDLAIKQLGVGASNSWVFIWPSRTLAPRRWAAICYSVAGWV